MYESAAVAEQVGFTWWRGVTWATSRSGSSKEASSTRPSERPARGPRGGRTVGDRVNTPCNLAPGRADCGAASGDAYRAGTFWGAVEAIEERSRLRPLPDRSRRSAVRRTRFDAPRARTRALGRGGVRLRPWRGRSTSLLLTALGGRGARGGGHRLIAMASTATCARGSRCSSGRASSSASPPRSTRTSRSPRSSTARSRPAAPRCCSSVRGAASIRSSSTSSGPSAGCAWRSASSASTTSAREARGRARDAAPEGLVGKAPGAEEAEVARGLAAEDGAERAGQEIVLRGDDATSAAADPDVLARRRRAVHHAPGGDHARPAGRAGATSGCTGCRSSTRARPRCTGRSTRTGARTTCSRTDGWRSQSRSGSTPSRRIRRARRCRSTSTS